MMHASITMAVEKFSSDRMVRDYFAKAYTGPEVVPSPTGVTASRVT